MKLNLLAALFFLSLGVVNAQNYYLDSIQIERDNFEHKLLQTDSIINKEEQQSIEKLNHFPIDSSWVLTAKFKKKKGKIFDMPTTTSRTPKYQRIGYLHFEKDNEKFKLAVYKNLGLTAEEYKNYVFVPFVDANAPEITYGGGRYLDLEMSIKDKTVSVDFNKTYNPYCVYSYRYSCPITPKENHIDVKVNAGIMNPDKTL
ncbi:DUF1684 domain-containing protein [Brumimicrobium glaciale]|uniref:DUF1684 domain-containing protein n=1 Tax=Brumimicrobium glaciale TaxID=200475 RepID=A0A4Q4KNH2_9FLAO|nr:DUF1684 domain-containing protein [Brumimicrobium glaciale]RYM34698.1 DUF1684 domain-containing protein [Brumimicrobium glaciale]